MRKTNSIFLVAIIFTLLSLNLCQKKFDIKNIQEWSQTDITTQDQSGIKNIHDDKYGFYNSETLQLTDSKIVVMLNGKIDKVSKQNQSQFAQKLVVYDSQGRQIVYKIFEDVEQFYVSTLALTNIKGEFLHIINQDLGIYISIYDENLNIKRNMERRLLDTFDDVFGYYEPIVSVGKDLLYIMLNVENYKHQYLNRVYVFDLSESSTIKFLNKYTYYNYPAIYFFSFSIQAFSDGSAIAHFYNKDTNNENILVQIKYNNEGEEELNRPTEIKGELIDLIDNYEFWPWYSFLHQNKQRATFLVNDLNDNLMIYTFNIDGEQICAKINDITGYNNQWYYYGIIGNKGWIYIADYLTLKGNFGFFDPNNCTLDLDSFVTSGLYVGIAGQLIDEINKKVFLFEFGNLENLMPQKTYQILLYEIGSYEGEDIFEGEGEDMDFIEGEEEQEEEEGEGEDDGEFEL